MAGNAQAVSGACAEVRRRLASAAAGRRLGQALWMAAGTPISESDLIWARGLLGDNAESLLFEALREAGCLTASDERTSIQFLSRFLCYLIAPVGESVVDSEVVWTFPEHLLDVPGLSGDSYARALMRLIGAATQSLTIIAPYLEARGVGLIEQGILSALSKNVSVILITHDADDLSSFSSVALRSLSSEARAFPGKLVVYTTASQGVLPHLKCVVVDGIHALVGSANITGKGLSTNIEAGVLVGEPPACEILLVVERMIASGLVRHAFST